MNKKRDKQKKKINKKTIKENEKKGGIPQDFWKYPISQIQKIVCAHPIHQVPCNYIINKND